MLAVEDGLRRFEGLKGQAGDWGYRSQFFWFGDEG